MHGGTCAVETTEITCEHGAWIPGLNRVCRNGDAITAGLSVVAVVALGVATGGLAAGAVISIGGSAGIAIPTGGNALALASGGSLAGGGAIILSPAAAGTIVGASTIAGLSPLIHEARDSSGKSGATNVPDWVKYEVPRRGEGAHTFAKRVLDSKYGPGGWGKGPRSEYNKIIKWFDRHFNA